MFILEQRPTRTSIFARFGGFSTVTIALIICSQWYFWGRANSLGLIAIGVMSAIMAMWIVISRNPYSKAPIGGLFLLCSSQGIVEYRDDGPQPFVPWRTCGDVRLRSRYRNKWDLKVYHNRERIINPNELRLRMAQCAIRFEATFDEAHIVLKEIETRIARAEMA